MGRNPVFDKEEAVRKNLMSEGNSDKPCVAEENEKVFRLVNYDIEKFDKESKYGVGHLNARSNLLMILREI
jgi:hypothetical protein